MCTVERVYFLASNIMVCHFTVIKKRTVQTGSCAAFRCLLTLQLTNNTMTLSCPSADPTSRHEVSPYNKLFTSTSTIHAHQSVSEPPAHPEEGRGQTPSAQSFRIKLKYNSAERLLCRPMILCCPSSAPSSMQWGRRRGGKPRTARPRFNKRCGRDIISHMLICCTSVPTVHLSLHMSVSFYRPSPFVSLPLSLSPSTVSLSHSPSGSTPRP